MIFWGLALGVSFVSIYDRKGVIVRNQNVFKKTVEAKAIQYVGVAKRACCSIDIHTLSDSDPTGKGRKNGERMVRSRQCEGVCLSETSFVTRKQPQTELTSFSS